MAQRKAARLERESAAGVHAAAERGISGASGRLPHLETIQRSFGKHDVSQIQAHTDGAASKGAKVMGAEAFASGDHVAFAEAPSLHTAAHEAAHVVQQRGGVQLKGGVGTEGDQYEQHADAVADRVVQGKSAESLLDQTSTSRSAAEAQSTGAAGPIQRKLHHGSRTYENPASLPSGVTPSPLVLNLIKDKRSFYLPDNAAANFTATRLTALQEKIYLLGEQHGDGSWTARTSKWNSIAKIREDIKGATPQSREEEAALRKAEVTIAGEKIEEGFPLEDFHSVALGRILVIQQQLNGLKKMEGANRDRTIEFLNNQFWQLDRLANELGAEAVPVPRGVDFDAMLTVGSSASASSSSSSSAHVASFHNDAMAEFYGPNE